MGVPTSNVFITSIVPNGTSTTVVVVIAGLSPSQLNSVAASLSAAAANGTLQSAMASQIPGVSVSLVSLIASDASGDPVTLNSPPPPGTSGSSSNNSLAIGLGVGLGVGGLIIIVIIATIIIKKKKSAQQQTVHAEIGARGA